MKGQWFIISAVVASSIFLGLSFLLKDYFVLDSSDAGKINNDFFFYNINNQLDSIVQNTVTIAGNCVNLTTALDEFKTIAERDLAAKGLFLRIDYTIVQCNPNIVKFDFIVATDEEIIYNFTTKKVSDVIG